MGKLQDLKIDFLLSLVKMVRSYILCVKVIQ